MNEIILSGQIKNIEYSHNIGDIAFDKALLIVPRDNGHEDVINIRFKTFSKKYKDNDNISIKGSIRSYSYKVNENKNKVIIFVFTYFDDPDEDAVNAATLDGRICKIDELRIVNSGKHNIHFIIANNLISNDNQKRLNSYIPCIAWGNIAKEIAKLSVNTKIILTGQLHSREHTKKLDNGDVEIRVAHEFLVTGFEVVS